MNFIKQIIQPLFSQEEYLMASLLVEKIKNAKLENGFLIQNFSEAELQRFKNYWNLIKPLLKIELLSNANYQLRWAGYSGSELYELELDSKTGHRIAFGFYPQIKEFDLYYYQDKDQPIETHLLTGKTKNLVSSYRVKELINLFQS